ncbi:MAG: RNA recognition motif domain-containing protein [Planctomycetota bacterium]|jgi:RNA recognition motif-containing protein
MSKRLFVGGLPWAVDDHALQDHFAGFGEVVSATVIRDRETQRSRGFGFVEFANDAEAAKAVDDLDGTEMEGRQITVSIAKSPGV